IMQVNERIKNTVIRRSVEVFTITFMVFMVVGRLISGVHWFSDIFGGAMFSAGLVMIYYSVSNVANHKL
ncbi:MAG: phosphatase PAP2 family protein, partial [Ruminococcus bromii]|nr:phosphatase PAP2 family protein [Ruminococcus bromii]